MKPVDIRAKSEDELRDQLRDLKKEAFNLRFQQASGQLENTSRVRDVRRDIARVADNPQRAPYGAITSVQESTGCRDGYSSAQW